MLKKNECVISLSRKRSSMRPQVSESTTALLAARTEQSTKAPLARDPLTDCSRDRIDKIEFDRYFETAVMVVEVQ